MIVRDFCEWFVTEMFRKLFKKFNITELCIQKMVILLTGKEKKSNVPKFWNSMWRLCSIYGKLYLKVQK